MKLEHIDLSGNFIDGSIPGALFDIPSIRTIALSINCFSGQLPLEICHAGQAQVFSLDGLPAASECSWVDIGLPLAKGFSPLEGGIPPCMWSLDNLTVMHLSGNGLTGTIGSFPISSSMLNLSRAHNR